MTAVRLVGHHVAKPWGRRRLGGPFAEWPKAAAPIGEIWFQMPDKDGLSDLMVKYLFTSEQLSVQVHPNDAQARAAGLPRGKDECWLVVEADADAAIALGTRVPTDRDTLRRAARDGSIEQLLDWKPVKAGDFYFVPAGTLHAIGAGITMIEIQQNCDATYRLYDYGRDRPLHLNEGLAVTTAAPLLLQPPPRMIAAGRERMVDGAHFTVERWSGGRWRIDLPPQACSWLVPVAGHGTANGARFDAGECLVVSSQCDVELAPSTVILLAMAGSARGDASIRRV